MVTIIIPCHNEEKVIRRLLQRITELTYPKEKLQVIVVNDHSTDNTGPIIEEFNERIPRLQVIHRCCGGHGKSEALNEALDFAIGAFTLFFDADYLPDRDIVEKFVPYFQDPTCGAVQGYIYVLNKGWIPNIVRLERIGGYVVDQYARERLGLLPQLGGTAMAVWTELIQVEKFDNSCIAEDTDLTFRILETGGFRVHYYREAKSGEEAPSSLKAFWNQRFRWAYGHYQVFFRHLTPLIRNEALTLREKLDGLHCLFLYFLPVIALANWILTAALIILGKPIFEGNIFISMLYLAFAGFGAPYSCVAGCITEERFNPLWWLPGLLASYVLNTLICTSALMRLAYDTIRGQRLAWRHTPHG